jgi:hypothetical protein
MFLRLSADLRSRAIKVVMNHESAAAAEDKQAPEGEGPEQVLSKLWSLATKRAMLFFGMRRTKKTNCMRANLLARPRRWTGYYQGALAGEGFLL